ncbi:hypothetical protein PHSC3_000609 [Chlamydiales bacterium STE3]|nr:hypothetical protein PHSC3_000609 [Chlamydiales bacterium STE3]
MFEVTATHAAIFYLGSTLLVIFGFWIYQHLLSRKKAILSNPEELFVCEYCHFAYLNAANKKVNRCPQCKSFNKDNRYQP